MFSAGDIPSVRRGIRRFAWKTLLKQCGNPRRTVAERFNLLVFDEDGVAANPIVAADRAVDQFRIANPAVVRLRIGQQWSLLKVLELDFEHVHPGALCSQVIGKRIVPEWPRMSFTPETVHESVDKLDERVAIEFRRQLSNQLFECLLKKRIVVPGLITRMRVL